MGAWHGRPLRRGSSTVSESASGSSRPTFPGPFGAEVAERIAERRGQREKLKGLTNLAFFVLRETKVTDAGVADLQQVLPNCEIKK